MTALRIQSLRATNFRCFEEVTLFLDPDVTVIFAENGGGKTTVLTAMAMALTLLQPRHAKELVLDGLRDARRIPSATSLWDQAQDCGFACTAVVAGQDEITWSASASSKARRVRSHLERVTGLIAATRGADLSWPLIAWYGTSRFALKMPRRTVPGQTFEQRWDGYIGALDPSTHDAPLLDWLRAEALGDAMRHRRKNAERHFDGVVFDAMRRAVPEVKEAWYELPLETPCLRFQDDSVVKWDELSDGFHVLLGMVGDIARRAMLLNGALGSAAPLETVGVVLIDEVDLHLHPRWQRGVIGGLRRAFPKLQLVVTTHSPQVLSSVKNDQVRRLRDGRVVDHVIHVEGRDTNAILRDEFDTGDRDEGQGQVRLWTLYRAIDDGRLDEARAVLEELRRSWGHNDPEVLRAESFLDEEA